MNKGYFGICTKITSTKPENGVSKFDDVGYFFVLFRLVQMNLLV